jgi:hypothetical protein
MIHDNQQEGFDDLLAEIDEPDRIPEEVAEDFARGLSTNDRRPHLRRCV